MAHTGFATFFKTLHGYPPFPWQRRLATMVADGNWPASISLPTGVGKTSILDVWAWAIHEHITVPLRLFYIIDRKLVVDSVSRHADLLAQKLDITAAKLRGGMLLDDAWVRDPAKPAIIVSTIDQTGSRLLFRGYGVTPSVAPIHAALAGNDSLLVLDEAHIAPHFLHTLKTIKHHYGGSYEIVEMSATPVSKSAPFMLTGEDYANPLLHMRLTRPKPVALVTSSVATIVHDIAGHALRLRNGGAEVIGVVVNRVKDARALFEKLKSKGDAVLLTGRIRDYDRQEILRKYLPEMESGSRAKGRSPLFVVATQTIEVGADLDFDALVTESTTLSGLRQRFGRLNRLGELEQAHGVIVHRDVKSDDGEYDKHIAETWKWLSKNSLKKNKQKTVDFSSAAMAQLAPPAEDPPYCPTLTPVHVKALAHTSPPAPVDIHPFLHGWDDTRDVTIVWRADFNRDNADQWPAMCDSVPAVVGETLLVPIRECRTWLRGKKHYNKTKQTVTTVEEKPPSVGDVLFVPASYGGCDSYGWHPDSTTPVRDVGDLPTEKRIRMRFNALVHPELVNISGWQSPDTWKSTAEIFGCAQQLVAMGTVKPYPGGFFVEAGLWSVQPAKTSRPVALKSHLAAVGARARIMAHHAGLAPELVEMVTEAATNHDTGKNDPAFQLMLGGTPERMLAKGSGGDSSYMPKGWRHEMLSALHHECRPLVKYLIGSHHGYGRGVFPAAPDQQLWEDLGGIGWGVSFYRLLDEYGPWRLAYMEAIVRLADWAVSEEEQL